MSSDISIDITEKFSCERCNKVCKDKRGLAIHNSKCKDVPVETIPTCKYCNAEFKTIYSLHSHYTSCQELKIFNIKEELKIHYQTILKDQQHQSEKEVNDIKNHYDIVIKDIQNEFTKKYSQYESTIKNIQTEAETRYLHYESTIKDLQNSSDKRYSQYEEKIRMLNIQHDMSIKSLSEEHCRHVTQIKSLEDTIKTITSQKTTLEAKIADLENKTYHFMNAYIQKDQREKAPTIINNNHSGNNNHITLQLDVSAFVGKIQPPHVMVGNVDQLLNLLQQNGLTKYYTVTDRSRKSLTWIDEKGDEIKDTNGTQMVTKLLKCIEPDITRQIQFQQEEVNQLRARKDAHNFTEAIQDRNNSIQFCQSLFAPVDNKLMNKITKGITAIAKTKKDKSVDTPPQAPGFKNLIASLVTALFPEVNKWFTLSPSTFGAYLYKHLRDIVHVEQPCLVNKTLYILNDQNAREKLSSRQFAKIIQDAIEEVFTPMVRNIVLHLYSVRLNRTTEQEERQNQMIDWIDNLTQPFSDQIVEGICRAGLS